MNCDRLQYNWILLFISITLAKNQIMCSNRSRLFRREQSQVYFQFLSGVQHFFVTHKSIQGMMGTNYLCFNLLTEKIWTKSNQTTNVGARTQPDKLSIEDPVSKNEYCMVACKSQSKCCRWSSLVDIKYVNIIFHLK